MFRDNPIGVLILGLCTVVGVVLMWQIITGDRLRYNGPDWLVWILAIVMLGGSLYFMFANRIRGENKQWPNPSAGQPSLWQRIKARFGGSGDSR